ncbi:MAG: acetylglutamate kinase [Flavobacteriaceae bacterium]|jgi:acetylglutamate kinase|nr:acetylglutamate kinase [Flavobacteriaceae bacterium]
MPKLNIVKIGGAIIEEDAKLLPFLENFAALEGPKILVHGGGKKATAWSEKLGIPVQMKDGRRVTDAATLELITGLYAGQVNKSIVAHLQGMNCNALGLSGADANAIQAVKRPVKAIDYGFVGDVKQVNNSWFKHLLHQNISPVCCAITHDKNGQLFNTNADTITAEIGKALAQDFEVKISYCFELPGVMKDINDSNSLIEKINQASYQQLLLNNTISAGMLPKLHNAFDALQAGVKEVAIGATNMINQTIPYTSITL